MKPLLHDSIKEQRRILAGPLAISMYNSADKRITWGASFSSASIYPDVKKLDFDIPVNWNSDFNDGWMLGGRVDLHPSGLLNFSEGDFKGDTRATLGIIKIQASYRMDEDGKDGNDVDEFFLQTQYVF